MTSRVILSTINESVKNAQYAVRGRIVARAAELQKAGRTTISCNIGNPHALGQKGISFVRNVLALVLAPDAKIDVPKDVYDRAKRYVSAIPDIGAFNIIITFIRNLLLLASLLLSLSSNRRIHGLSR